jgi:hypothetical protein
VARRIVDRRVRHLIKMWLDCPVEQTDHEDGSYQPRRATIGAAFRRAHPFIG